MSPELLLVIALGIIVAALLLRRRTQRQREDLRLPEGEVIYQDTAARPAEILYSRIHKLVGKPDRLITQADGTIIPIEVKTGRTPESPYLGHVMQLMVYCVLIEENFGVRPPHGIIQYPDRDFTVAFTPAQEAQLHLIVADMRRKKTWESIPRNHNNSRVCGACGYNTMCDERVEG
jgi:CRISPR-associated exonuclease Cas4